MADELTPEQIEAAAQAEAEKNKPIEITDELFEAEMQKRMGGSSKDFIKKEEQIKVLTDDEKKAIQEQKYQDSLTVALEKNWVKRKDYDEYLSAEATDRVQIARQQYIKDHPDLGDKAGAKFDKIYMVNEEDEIVIGEGTENEKFVPNEDKKIALAAAAKIGEEIINNKYAAIKALPQRHENYLAEVALVEQNTKLVTKAISEIPKEIEYKWEGIDRTYKFKFTEDDFKAAEAMVLADTAKSKDLKPEDVKGAVAMFLQSKNIAKIIKEVEKVAYKAGVEDTEKGKSGIEPDRSAPPGSEDEKMKFFNKYLKPA